MVKIIATEQNFLKKKNKNDVSLRDFWDNITCTNIQIIEFPEDKVKASEKIVQEIIVESFPHIRKRIINQVQEVQRGPYKVNPKGNMLRHILIKLSKNKYKEKILKTAREDQQITYRRIPIRLSTNILAETLQAKSKWQNIFKVMKGENLQPRLLHPAELSSKFDKEIKSFTEKQKLREFSTTRLTLQQMLKELL